MSAKLKLLERQMVRRQERIPVPPETSGGIGAAIEQLIADEVASRVTDATEKQTNKRLDRLFHKPDPYTDYRQIPAPLPVQKPFKPVNMTVTRRDELGGIQTLEMATEGSDRLTICEVVQRDGYGRIMAMKMYRQGDLPPMGG
ncbi:hypothetical protein [Pseudomonas sp. FW300-N2A2]|uniref:hypothetical protein n=1 Tax=Pseudomonas sp. FW300-N2A2 TaxID=2751316 RepID=UPI001A92CBAD|nr:hypothetical protein [Pseudomonas sp. FW300-N2A2]